MTDSNFELLWDMAMGEAFTRGEAPKSEPLITKRYVILRDIATGGMGKVVLAHDQRMKRDVAMKLIRAEFRNNPKSCDRFVREALIAGQLQHPGVVPVYELDTDESGDVFLTMRPIAGKTLAEILRTPPDPLGHLRIFEQVCQTMAYAHSQGVIHRDLKPDNIMVGAFGEVQVLDWGLAKVLKSDVVDDPGPTVMSPGPTNLSVAGMVIGTPMYMAPEQALGDPTSIDERTDVFSLGAILCEILTGTGLYADSDATTAITRAARAELDDAFGRLDRAAADPELRDLAKACLMKFKNDRPRNAGEVAKRLGAYLSSIADRAHKAEVRAAADRVQAEGERRARRLITAVAALGLLIVAGGAFLLWKRAEAKREAVRDVEALLTDSADRAARGELGIAEEAAGRAEALGLKEGVDAALVDRAKERSRTYRAQKEERGLIVRLDEVRRMGGGPPQEIEARYVGVFKEVGIDLPRLSAAEIGGQVAAQAEPIRGRLIAALDDWASRCPPDATKTWTRAVESAIQADSDPWRNRLRKAMLDGDRATILEIAGDLKSIPPSPESFMLLGQGVHRSNQGFDVEWRVLSEGQRRHPDDFFLNFTMANRALEHDGSLDLAERHARIGISLKPESPDVRAILGLALYLRKGPGDLEEAKGLLESSLDLMKDKGPREAVRCVLLLVEGKTDEANRLMDELRRRPGSMPPWMRRLSGDSR